MKKIDTEEPGGKQQAHEQCGEDIGMKFNCGEFKQWGREPGGANFQFGSCPAIGGPRG